MQEFVILPLWRRLVSLVVIFFLVLAVALPPPAFGLASVAEPTTTTRTATTNTSAADPASLEAGHGLFDAHCAGCHLQGGNIIRRGKTLKLAALQRNGLDDSAAIARIAASGIGQMGGYAAVLGDGGPEAVADWVWRMALDGWPRS